MGSKGGRTHDWGDDDEVPVTPRPRVAWWKTLLAWLPAGVGVVILLLGMVQFLPLLVAPDVSDNALWYAMALGPALLLVLLGCMVLVVGLLVRWALGGALRR